MNANIKKQQGFTLIEVILVLAIAALIFLMIFIALPALQASQRDTARKNDAAIVASAVTQYTSAYRGPLSDAGNATDANLREYVTDLDQYDNTNVIDVIGNSTASQTTTPGANQIWVNYASKCNGPDIQLGTSRQATVRVALENGTSYCVDAS